MNLKLSSSSTTSMLKLRMIPAAAALALASSANALPIYSGPQNLTVTRPSSPGASTVVTFNVDGLPGYDAYIQAHTLPVAGYVWMQFYTVGPGLVVSALGANSPGGGYTSRLADGAIIDGSSTGWDTNVPGDHPNNYLFATGAGAFNQWAVSTAGGSVDGYVGLKFHQGAGGLGWVRVRVEDSFGFDTIPDKITVIDWAFEAGVSSLRAGTGLPPVPDGGSTAPFLGLVALGLIASKLVINRQNRLLI